MDTSNTNKPRVLITGGSKGIGYELARVFAENGYDLIINADTESVNEAVSHLRNLGANVEGIMSDLSTQEGVDRLYQEATKLGQIDVLVVNAGVGTGGEFIKNDFDHELMVMNLNMVYPVYLTKLILRDMVNRNEGKILFTSSIAAEMAAPYNAVYGATKSFIQSFAQAIRVELEDTDKSVVVTTLQPGPTETEFFEKANLQDTKVGEMKKDDPARVARDGFEALMKGEQNVISGITNKAQVAMSKLTTENMRAKAHGMLNKPNELKQ